MTLHHPAHLSQTVSFVHAYNIAQYHTDDSNFLLYTASSGIVIYEEYKRAKDAHEKAREDNEAKPKDVDEKKRTEHLWYNIARDRKATKRALAESLEIGYRNSDKHSAEINDLHKKIQVLIERLSDTKGELKDIREHADEQSASIREQFAAFRGELSDNTHHLTVIDNYIVTGVSCALTCLLTVYTDEVHVERCGL